MAGIGAIVAGGLGIATTVKDIAKVIRTSQRRRIAKLNKDEYERLKNATDTFRNINRILRRYIIWYHDFTTLSLSLQKLNDFIDSNLDTLKYDGKDPIRKAEQAFCWKRLNILWGKIARLKNTKLIKLSAGREEFFNEKDRGLQSDW